MKITFPETRQEMVISYEGRSKTAVVLGADSFIGFCVTQELVAQGHAVIASGESSVFPKLENCTYEGTDYSAFRIPENCNVVFFCHDVAKDTELHLRALKNLCEHLTRTFSRNHQVYLAYFSSANICASGKGAIKESALLCPHNQRELAVCNAEMLLTAYKYIGNGAILSTILRYGELYGEEGDWTTTAGYLNECIALARQGKNIPFHGDLFLTRTVTHVKDLAAAAVATMYQDFVSGVFNVPGEKLVAHDCVAELANRYGVELEAVPETLRSDNHQPYAGDHVLSTHSFKATVPDFKPLWRFRDWLKKQKA